MLLSFQYWAKCSPMDFSKCRYSLASAKSCLLWVGSKTKYGTSTTPTTPPQALKHTSHMVTVTFFFIVPTLSSFSGHITYMPPSSWGPVFSYILMRREQLYTNIPSRSLWSMFTPNIKFSSLGSFSALKNKRGWVVNESVLYINVLSTWCVFFTALRTEQVGRRF